MMDRILNEKSASNHTLEWHILKCNEKRTFKLDVNNGARCGRYLAAG